MGGRPLVVICALRDRLFAQVRAAVLTQWPEYAVHLDEPYPLRTYADFVRTVWAGLGDLVIVEGDVVPPAGSIEALLTCPHPWCSHPSWVGDKFLDNTLGLVKFSESLQLAHPFLADNALAREQWRGNDWNRGLESYRPAKHLGYVDVGSSVLAVWPELSRRAMARVFERGTTAHPKAIDMRLDYELGKAKVRVHVHQPAAEHLRYPNDPATVAKSLTAR